MTSRKTIAYCISEGNPLKGETISGDEYANGIFRPISVVLDNIDAISDTEEKDMNSGVNIAHAGRFMTV